jgi:hypothetical protein
MTDLISIDENGNKWFEMDSHTYGLTLDNRLLDSDGIPFHSDAFSTGIIDELSDLEVETTIAKCINSRCYTESQKLCELMSYIQEDDYEKEETRYIFDDESELVDNNGVLK